MNSHKNARLTPFRSSPHDRTNCPHRSRSCRSTSRHQRTPRQRMAQPLQATGRGGPARSFFAPEQPAACHGTGQTRAHRQPAPQLSPAPYRNRTPRRGFGSDGGKAARANTAKLPPLEDPPPERRYGRETPGRNPAFGHQEAGALRPSPPPGDRRPQPAQPQARLSRLAWGDRRSLPRRL